MAERLLKRIEVLGLFGQFNYSMPKTDAFSNAAILYGDNGIGKSTILRLVFHLLSGAKNRGHRTAIAKVPFRRLTVELTSGIVFSAERVGDNIDDGTIHLKISRSSQLLSDWIFNRNHPEGAPSVIDHDGDLFFISDDGIPQRLEFKGNKSPRRSLPKGESHYLRTLAEHAPAMFYVNADRRLDSDTIADPNDEVELRRAMRMEETRRLHDLVARSREIALSQALISAGRWVQRKAVVSANQGSTNVHSVYTNVVKHLSGSAENRTTAILAPSDLQRLRERVEAIGIKSGELARYELSAQLDTRDFRRSLSGGSTSRRNLAAEVLDPYVKSLEGRLGALEPLYNIVHEFVTTINSFLRGKRIDYKLTQGFTITSNLGTRLDAPLLSSGEQQLLLMFCYALTAREMPSVFMIDEPEISLNIKWQRQLLQSLMNVTEDEKIQFIVASHSMELIAQHRNRVVKLG